MSCVSRVEILPELARAEILNPELDLSIAGITRFIYLLSGRANSEENMKDQFQGAILTTDNVMNIEGKWVSFEEITKKTEQVLRKEKRESGKHWYVSECKEA